jgi:hypothetical protein
MPSPRDLADARLIEQWRLLSIPHGAEILTGSVRSRTVAHLVVTIDSDAGWARTAEGWLVLGRKAVGEVSIDWGERLPQDPMPKDAEGLIAWAKRNLFD